MASSAAKDTGVDQTAPMRSLISAFVVHIRHFSCLIGSLRINRLVLRFVSVIVKAFPKTMEMYADVINDSRKCRNCLLFEWLLRVHINVNINS